MTRFITFVSGKGGVGKTTSAINVGQALHNMEKDVLLVDASLGTPNLSLKLGIINPVKTVNSFLRKEHGIHEIIHQHDSGLRLIPASPSYSKFQETPLEKIPHLFEHLDKKHKYVLIDAPSGINQEVHTILTHSDEVIVVVTPTLSSVIDALKTMEIAKEHGNIIAGIILNMSNSGKDELSKPEVEEILGHPILAEVRYSRKVRKAMHKQLPLNYKYPHSRAARQFRKVAEHISFYPPS